MSEVDVVTQVREKLGALDTFMADVTTRLDTLDSRTQKAIQIAATGGGRLPAALTGSGDGDPAAPRLTANQDLAAWIKAGHTKQSALAISMPFVTRAKSLVTKAVITSPAPAAPLREIAGPVNLPLRLADLIPTTPTASGAVIFTTEQSFTPNGDIVAETTRKPESTFAFQNKTVTAAVIATIAKMSLQALNDSPALGDWVGQRLSYAVSLRSEQYLLNDSTAGLIANASALDAGYAPAAPATGLDVIAAALSQLEALGYAPNAVVLNGKDVATLRRLKDGNDNYAWADPDSPIGTSRIWAVPLVISSAMAPGTFLVADFQAGTMLFLREAMNVQVSYENEDDFVLNLCTFRAEMRESLAVLIGAGLVKGSLTVAP